MNEHLSTSSGPLPATDPPRPSRANVSVFDLFKVGIGPSSSHTVGPMRAAGLLLAELGPQLATVTGLTVELMGSLGATGRGHGTDRAILAGLQGLCPETVAPEAIEAAVTSVRTTGQLYLGGVHPIPFDLARDVVFQPRQRLAYHPNALRFCLRYDAPEATHLTEAEPLPGAALAPTAVTELTYYSVGGGFVVADDGTGQPPPTPVAARPLPYPFASGADLVAGCVASGLDVAELMLRNEVVRGRSRSQVRADLAALWAVMAESISVGCHVEGVLPGGLGVRRRAPRMLRQLKHSPDNPLSGLDWVSLWALAVNEQNAAGGRIVTAPTNGAAGIIPAVVMYALRFLPGSDEDTVVDFLLAAGAIGAIYQATASISGAEVGCQGEIGVASSMAAAGLAQVLGASPQQVVNAAEIGLEHHLGLTCDPVAGLVQVPCIERNAIGATTAITATRLALAGDGHQVVSLDQVIATMMATGRDMQTKYKETSEGGLALSVVAC